VLSHVSVAVYFAIAISFAVISLQTQDPWPFLLSCFLILFFIHIITLFLEEEMENDNTTLVAEASIESFLSHELVTLLAHKKHATAGDLLDAAVHTKRGKFILEELTISPADMIQKCRSDIDENVDLELFLDYAKHILPQFKETRIDANIVLYLFFNFVTSCTQLLNAADLSEEDLTGLLHWEHFHHHFHLKNNAWSADSIAHTGSLGRSWIMGYTDALDMLTEEVDTIQATSGEMSVVIHQDEIENVLRTLTHSGGGNVLMMGKIGVGKKTLVHNIACELRNFERSKHLPFTRVLMLQTEKLMSGVGSPDTFLLQALSRAQRSGRYILVFRDLSLLLRSADNKLITVLKKCLESTNIAVIGIVDIQDYHALIKTDPMLDSQFEKVTVDDATDEETMQTLMAHYFALQKHNVRMTYKALKSVLELTKRFLSMRGGLPGNALDVMDEAVVRAHEQGDSFVREEHVRKVISVKSRVNVLQVTEGDKERLLMLEDTMQNCIIEQEAAIHAVVSSLKRARMDLRERKKPMGTFLFLGPTGVGKTETAKVLAEQYFGAHDAMVRLDMNEYSHADSVFGVIGRPGSSEGFLAERVQDKPFSLILLDEIEKGHPTVLNLFLQILDEGFLTDSRGIRTDFRNTIIIATSNAGALFIRDFVRDHQDFDKATFKASLLDSILQQKLFSPEFVNRFDEVVLFYPLSQNGAAKVAALMINDVAADLQKRRGITVTLDEDVISALVTRGYSVEFGAREMRRTITDVIEDYLADYLLRHDVKRGESIVIRAVDLK
jgi:ATP-dependent Clp protease ATP-binding subunit ClpC